MYKLICKHLKVISLNKKSFNSKETMNISMKSLINIKKKISKFEIDEEESQNYLKRNYALGNNLLKEEYLKEVS